MMSARAAAVAEVLWELKRADKVATYSVVAARAGFSAGANGRAMQTALKAVRRDWPHLEWWRAISDDGAIKAGTEQVQELTSWGAEFGDEVKGMVALKLDEERLMIWEDAPENASVNS
ncbi:MAG: hypothetical protein KDA58_10125 [Planctomycetaceae bacterium]|nr:hypothetical protein [Planctomycetaceae bacterium]